MLATTAPQAADPPQGRGAGAPPAWPAPYGVPAWGAAPTGAPSGRGNPYGAQPPAQPAYGGMPGTMPGSPPGAMPGGQVYAPYGQVQPQAADTTPPRVEVQLSDPAPYVQQGVMLTLRLLSGSNLAEATPELPTSGAAMVRSLGDPRASVRQVGAKREIVSEFQFVLTPLESGDLTLPGLRVRGSHASTTGGPGRPFDVRSEPIRLNVRPAAAGVEPWLPLYHFAMRGQLTGDDRPAAGKPIGLMVEIVAVGATGGQLPSAEGTLREATEFGVYLEGTDLEGGTTPDGRFLTGRRVERYTLVPQYGGKLHVPAVRVPWFNLSLGRQETTELPIRQIVAEGPPPPQDQLRMKAQDIVPAGKAAWLFWAPLFLLVPVMLGYAVMVFSPPPPVTARTAQEAAAAKGSRIAGWLGKALSAISPWRFAEWMRPRVASALPVAARLWFCLRIVEREDEPEDWAMLLKFLSAKHLGISAQLPLPELGEEIVRHAARRADPTRVRELMVQLDDALYGGKPIGDFTAWKRAFRRETRPRLFARRPRSSRPIRDLPALNPSGKI